MRHYEGMFLLDPVKAGQDWDGSVGQVREVLEGVGAQITQCTKWDDRKLAYEIQGHSRAIYLLVLFNAPSSNIRQIERACQLSDLVLRELILLRDEAPLSPEAEAEETPEEEGEAEPEAASETEEASSEAGAPEAEAGAEATGEAEPDANGGQAPSEGEEREEEPSS